MLRKWSKLHQQRLAGTSLQPAPLATAFVPAVEVASHEAVIAREPAKVHRRAPAVRTSMHAKASAQMANRVALRLARSGNERRYYRQ